MHFAARIVAAMFAISAW